MSAADRLASPDIVTVYGVDSCDDTTRARRRFEAAGLPFRYVNFDEDAASKARVNAAGYHATPVIVTPAGQVLVEPSDEELDRIVASSGGAVGSSPSVPADPPETLG
jgi:glutaredoxin